MSPKKKVNDPILEAIKLAFFAVVDICNRFLKAHATALNDLLQTPCVGKVVLTVDNKDRTIEFSELLGANRQPFTSGKITPETRFDKGGAGEYLSAPTGLGAWSSLDEVCILIAHLSMLILYGDVVSASRALRAKVLDALLKSSGVVIKTVTVYKAGDRLQPYKESPDFMKVLKSALLLADSIESCWNSDDTLKAVYPDKQGKPIKKNQRNYGGF